MVEEHDEVTMPKIEDEMVETTVCGTWSLNPRHFYDFFDGVNVIVSAIHAGEGFYYSINGNTSDNYYATRREAEAAGFLEALSVTETSLS